MLRNQKGFNLIELMVVVGIIGTLAAIAVPTLSELRHRGRQAEAKVHLNQLYSSMKLFHSNWLQYYGDFRNLGFDLRGTLTYRVGFNSSFSIPAAPANYVGPGLVAGSPGVMQLSAHSAGFCSVGGVCEEDPNFTIGLTPPATNCRWTANTFLTCACAGISQGAGVGNRECLALDESKNLSHFRF